MTDIFTQKKRSEIMSRIHGTDTGPEFVVRSLLNWMGYRFRLHRADLPGKPDIVLPRHRKIIFVNGCFWHGHKSCQKGRSRPTSHARFWKDKIEGNAARDKKNTLALRRRGWSVLTVWECETIDPFKLFGKLLRFMEK